MPTTNPRVNVTFNPNDAECLHLICKNKHMSMAGLVRKVVEDWLEDYEDTLLAKRAEEAEKKWIEEGCKSISHEELCQELGIKLNIPQNPEKTLFDSPKTSKKGSSAGLNKDSRSRRKTASH
jgi:predicted DNA-binding protein